MRIIGRHPALGRTLPLLRELEDDLWNWLPGNADRFNDSFADWTPATDVHDEDERFVIRADLPGLQASDIDITVEDGRLTIKGERKFQRNHEGNNGRRFERIEGSFVRSFSLPDNVDVDRISATSRDGVLQVVIEKKESTQPKRIPVQA